jgi:hypothetical protein
MKKPCTLYLKEIEYEEPSVGKPDSKWDCELDPVDADGIEGIFMSFEGLNLQSNATDSDSRPLISGESTLFANGIEINHGQAKARFPKGARPAYGRRPHKHRHLATVTGTKPVLAVRVIGADTSTTASMVEISDSIFGTAGDPVNLKSQFAACSFNKLNITPTPGFAGTHHGLHCFLDCTCIETTLFSTRLFFFLVFILTDGVVTVTIPNIISGATDGTIRNAVTTALNAAGISAPTSGHHIMYCLPPGTSGSWIAYAYVNSWNSVYNNQWCTYVSTDNYHLTPSPSISLSIF